MSRAHVEIPLPPAEFVSYIGGGDFVGIGQHLFELVRERCGVRSSDRVLDLGSGCGRVAIPFTHFLTTGEYDGIEIIRSMVDWCRHFITGPYPNFRFHHADVANTAYSPTGGEAAQFTFPFPADSFDTIHALSVFTHLLPASAQRYLHEIRRVLKPDGRALLTFLLLNDRSRQSPGFAFSHRGDRYAFTEKQAPERILAYDEDYALEMIRSSGLAIEALSYGKWAGHDGWTYQDTVLVSPAARTTG